jgi:hypothetical protein
MPMHIGMKARGCVGYKKKKALPSSEASQMPEKNRKILFKFDITDGKAE